MVTFMGGHVRPILYMIRHFLLSILNPYNNESTTGADASVEALKLYHMKLTLAYSSLVALHASDSNSLPEYKKWEMIAVIVAKKVLGRARL